MSVTRPGGRLDLQLQPTSEDVYEPDFLREVPLIPFAAYLASSRLFGWVRLEASRLTDLLNACESISLENVEVADFERGSIRSAEQTIVERGELIAVHAIGPRGDEAQRRPTRTVPIAAWSGNFVVCGNLHVVAGDDPLESWSERPPLVPLTEAWIEYWSDDERAHRSSGTIIVNRDRADLVRVLDRAADATELRQG